MPYTFPISGEHLPMSPSHNAGSYYNTPTATQVLTAHENSSIPYHYLWNFLKTNILIHVDNPHGRDLGQLDFPRPTEEPRLHLMHVARNGTSTDQLPFSEWLQLSEFEETNGNLQLLVATRIISGSLSILASIALMTLIFRSKAGIRGPFHRLMLGLCIADLCSSMAYIFGGIMVPSDLRYISHLAIGNVTTCNISGMLLLGGTGATALYNASLCFYSLIVVKFKKTDSYIAKKVEPLLHLLSAGIPLAVTVAIAANKGFNASNNLTCISVPYDPPHCRANLNLFDDTKTNTSTSTINFPSNIPCGRGKGTKLLSAVSIAAILTLSFCIMLSSMIVVYRDVGQHERKMSVYGASAIRMSIASRNRGQESCKGRVIDRIRNQNRHKQSGTISDNEDQTKDLRRSTTNLRKSAVKTKRSSLVENARRSNINVNVNSDANILKRVPSKSSQRPQPPCGPAKTKRMIVLQKALAYSCAWICTYIFVIIALLIRLIGGKEKVPSSIVLLVNIFHPLQGFYNFIIYIYPSVIHFRKNENGTGSRISWFQAFLQAIKSRGHIVAPRRRRNVSIPHSNKNPRRSSATSMRQYTSRQSMKASSKKSIADINTTNANTTNAKKAKLADDSRESLCCGCNSSDQCRFHSGVNVHVNANVPTTSTSSLMHKPLSDFQTAAVASDYDQQDDVESQHLEMTWEEAARIVAEEDQEES